MATFTGSNEVVHGGVNVAIWATKTCQRRQFSVVREIHAGDDKLLFVPQGGDITDQTLCANA